MIGPKLIGKLDPVTKEVISTSGKRGRKPYKSSDLKISEDSFEEKYNVAVSELKERDSRIIELNQKLAELSAENARLRRTIDQAAKLLLKSSDVA